MKDVDPLNNLEFKTKNSKLYFSVCVRGKNESGQVSAASSAIARLRIDTSRHGYYYGHKNKQ
jgi:hypothetical protein